MPKEIRGKCEACQEDGVQIVESPMIHFAIRIYKNEDKARAEEFIKGKHWCADCIDQVASGFASQFKPYPLN